MKKTVKKLTLAKETLRNLNEEQLENVGGALSENFSGCPNLSCGFICTRFACA